MADRSRGNGKTIKYRPPININPGKIIFLFIITYLVISVVMSFRSKRLVGYEVQNGSLSVNNIYRAFAIRDEEIFNSGYSGYINYFVREGTRVAVGDMVYTVDETGRLNERLVNTTGENNLTNEDLSGIKNEAMSFASLFNPREFSSVYDFKYSLEGTMMQLGSFQNIQAISDELGTAGMLNIGRATKTGIVTYYTDGFESIKPDDVTMEVFSEESYERTPLVNNGLINAGEPAYKVSTSERWSLILPINDADIEVDSSNPDNVKETYKGERNIRVKFLKTQNYSWGEVFIYHNADGPYMRLEFSNSMITFCNDRFIDIEIDTEETKGLKIPNTAIVEKKFYLVPKEYLVNEGPNGNPGVYREAYTEDGQPTKEFVDTPIYSEDDEDYFLGDEQLRLGDRLLHPDGGSTFSVASNSSLNGVYNINKGYADFKEIEVLHSNDEYSIVKSGTNYGLSVYDYIALDAQSVEENAIINE